MRSVRETICLPSWHGTAFAGHLIDSNAVEGKELSEEHQLNLEECHKRLITLRYG